MVCKNLAKNVETRRYTLELANKLQSCRGNFRGHREVWDHSDKESSEDEGDDIMHTWELVFFIL